MMAASLKLFSGQQNPKVMVMLIVNSPAGLEAGDDGTDESTL